MSAKRFILYCEEVDGAFDVKKELLTVEGVEVELVHTALGVADALLKGDISCVVVNTKVFNADGIKMIQTWRRVKATLAIMVVTDLVAKEVFRYRMRQKQMVTFERPVDYEDLKKLCQKVVNGQEIYQRRHERFATDQAVTIENLITSQKMLGIIKNMSRGGSLLKMNVLPAEGDVLKVSISLPKVAKQHVVHGEVVRLMPDLFGAGEHGVGILYISPEELYNALLSS